MAPNALRDIVLSPSLISSVTGVSGPSGLTTNNLSAFTSPIPWRQPGIRYIHNDIYFDIAETLDTVVNENGTIVTSSVLGKIDVDCMLSGTPDLFLTLTNSHTISEPSFRPCAFELSFTPRAGALEDVAVELYLGSSAMGAAAPASGCTCPRGARCAGPLYLRDPGATRSRRKRRCTSSCSPNVQTLRLQATLATEASKGEEGPSYLALWTQPPLGSALL
ncbi:Mu homology domain-containing protein [Lactarius sanguifluus]|nr:Mu homology domain-containing protein [Lactarius sanguifluus]